MALKLHSHCGLCVTPSWPGVGGASIYIRFHYQHHFDELTSARQWKQLKWGTILLLMHRGKQQFDLCALFAQSYRNPERQEEKKRWSVFKVWSESSSPLIFFTSVKWVEGKSFAAWKKSFVVVILISVVQFRGWQAPQPRVLRSPKRSIHVFLQVNFHFSFFFMHFKHVCLALTPGKIMLKKKSPQQKKLKRKKMGVGGVTFFFFPPNERKLWKSNKHLEKSHGQKKIKLERCCFFLIIFFLNLFFLSQGEKDSTGLRKWISCLLSGLPYRLLNQMKALRSAEISLAVDFWEEFSQPTILKQKETTEGICLYDHSNRSVIGPEAASSTFCAADLVCDGVNFILCPLILVTSPSLVPAEAKLRSLYCL